MGTQFPAVPASVAGPTNPQINVAQLIRQLQLQRALQARSQPAVGLAPYAQPWRGYAKGGDVRGHGHNTGDPHVDNMLDELYDAMSGQHPDPEGAAMNYADLLMPGSMQGYQPQGGGPGSPPQTAGPSLADLIMGPGGGAPGDGQGAGSDQDGDQDVGLVSGSGGGMDDDVAAQSDDGSPVALSNGEFVIPADVVSMLGDGNTEAGAQKLYELIDQIRQQKQGNTDQGEPTPDDIFSQLQSPEGGEEAEPEEEGGAPPQGGPPGPPLPPEQQEQPGTPSGMARGGWR